MTKISASELDSPARKIALDHLQSQGYTRQGLPLDEDVAQAFAQLANGAWELPVDIYYKPGNRRRTINRYRAVVTEDGIEVSSAHDGTPYFQDKKYNTTLGGMGREYPPLPEALSTSAGLHKAIAHHLARLPLSVPGQQYDVNLHVMRYSALPDKPCDTSPSGFHKDGEKYIAVTLLAFCGVSGGEVAIANNDKVQQESFVMREIGETYTIDDEKVWHKLSPVHVAPHNGFAYRDILLFDFIPVGWTATY